MQVGYARTSTIGQAAGFEAQLARLQAVGCEKVFSEQVSSVATRAQLQAAIDFVREGDVLVATSIDRLARSVAGLLEIVQLLADKKVGVRILNLGIDTQAPTGKLVLAILGGIAQFEREIMLERQREGVAKAKAAGKYKGRKPIALAKKQAIVRLAAEGVSKASIAKQAGVGEATVYRVLKAIVKKTCVLGQ